METILIILAKLIASSALLYAFYWLVMRNKATYTMARIYLLLIPFVSIAMSGLTFKVIQPKPVAVEMSAAPTTTPSTSEVGNDALPVFNAGSTATSSSTSESTKPSLLERFEVDIPIRLALVLVAIASNLNFWLLCAWGAVALVLIIIALYHIIYLYVMSRRMEAKTMPEGFRLIRSPKVPAPCSFAKTVFMPTTLTSTNEDLILRHEKAHIRHAHFVDVWVMELMTRLLWFNPLMWLTRNELRNVHEFEADHDVMQTGADMSVYQTLLLAQVMDHGSDYANGFNHSFIRRRFIEMKHSTAGTLGRIGKAAMCLWVALLFCGFTFAEKDAAGSTGKPLSTLELAEPQMFTIECEVGSHVIDKSFNIFLADDYMKIQNKKPVATVPVIDGKFHYEISLTKITAGRICGTRPGAMGIDIFFVPGETIKLHHYDNDEFNLEPTISYALKIDRGVIALRNATNWESPHLPKIKGKKWDNVSCISLGYPELIVKEVFFDKDETVLRIVPDDAIEGMIIRKDSYLTDGKGGKYMLRRALYGKLDELNSTDVLVFGGYYAFDPVPEKVGELNFVSAQKIGNTVMDEGPGVFHIKKAPKPVAHKPNFKVDITVSQGINDSGYLVSMYDKGMERRTQIADIPVVNRKASFATYVDEPRMVDLTATFPDGSICTHCMRFPFVPGEHAEVKVMNGTFYLTGTTFYKQYGDADELIENAGKYHKQEETQALLLDYLKKHADEEGCVMRYMHHDVLSRETILSIIPDKVRNGRFKDFLQFKNI